MEFRGATDRGLVRRTNQDCFAAGNIGNVPWAVVCDGMGGAAGGNIASEMAVRRFIAIAEGPDAKITDGKSAERFFLSAISSANTVIYERARKEAELYGMGTTAVAAAVVNDTAYIAHVGDSRAYLIDETGIKRLTRDHSVVQSLVESGEITDEQAKNHQQKNIITRAVGVLNGVEIEFDSATLKKGDILLLCSDGLNNSLSDEEIRSAVCLQDPPSPERLIYAANERGGKDNITAVLIKY